MLRQPTMTTNVDWQCQPTWPATATIQGYL